jgi:4-hydroxy-tetrahydrodipicolinate synthase
MTFQGTFTALVTPFDEHGRFDAPAMESLVHWQIEQGINGLVVCGSTGEAATLDDEEYSEVVACVVRAAAGRVPVVAGAGSNNTARAIELSRRAKEAGAGGLLHVTPFYNKPTKAGLIAHFRAIAEAVDLPIIAYNVPGRTGLNMTAEVTLALSEEVPQVIAVKEASGNIEQVMAIVANRREGFLVLSGDDALTLPMVAAGADGLISVASNQIPHELTSMVQAARDGDFETARRIHYEWLDLMNINFIETNPIPVKTALARMGHIQEQFRLPLVPMEENTKKQLYGVMERHGL